MANTFDRPITLVLFLAFCVLLPVNALRAFEQRQEPAALPSVSASTWTVPLDGSNTCGPDGECWSSLMAPPGDKVLEVLAVGRGTFNYTCENMAPDNAPAYVNQYTELYNAAPLMSTLPNEQYFHDLVPGFCDFDYGQLDNSTLECLGTIGTLNGSAVITLYDIVTFEAVLEQTVNPPDDPQVNGLWALSRSLDHTWEMYRVEMAGGEIPNTCENRNQSFSVTYAAEYWFYHGTARRI